MTGPPMSQAALSHSDLVFEVSGPFACWTRPDLKVERVSYPVPTPSGARGVVEAVFWKPEVSVLIRRIEVLNPVSWTRITRNEVTNVVTEDWLIKAQTDPCHRFDAAEKRDQRSALLLRDVRYRIHFQYVMRPHADGPPAKYRDQFRRRVERGACDPAALPGDTRILGDVWPCYQRQAAGRTEPGSVRHAALHRVRRWRSGNLLMVCRQCSAGHLGRSG